MFSQAVGWEDASTVEAKCKAQVAKCKEEASKFKEEADAACSLLAGVRGELAGVQGELAEAQRALDSAGAREAKLLQQTRLLQELRLSRAGAVQRALRLCKLALHSCQLAPHSRQQGARRVSFLLEFACFLFALGHLRLALCLNC